VPEKIIVCFGDAAAEDGLADESERWPSLLRARLSTFGSGIYRVIDAETPELTTGAALERIDNAVTFHRPHLVSLRFGNSDSRGIHGTAPTAVGRFEANLRTIAQLIRERTGAIVLLIVAPATVPLAMDGSIDALRPYHDITRRVAYELNAPLLDLYPELPPPAGALDLRLARRQAHDRYAAAVLRTVKRLL
jgi:lysophospholipase L1-like esterase